MDQQTQSTQPEKQQFDQSIPPTTNTAAKTISTRMAAGILIALVVLGVGVYVSTKKPIEDSSITASEFTGKWMLQDQVLTITASSTPGIFSFDLLSVGVGNHDYANITGTAQLTSAKTAHYDDQKSLTPSTPPCTVDFELGYNNDPKQMNVVIAKDVFTRTANGDLGGGCFNYHGVGTTFQSGVFLKDTQGINISTDQASSIPVNWKTYTNDQSSQRNFLIKYRK